MILFIHKYRIVKIKEMIKVSMNINMYFLNLKGGIESY